MTAPTNPKEALERLEDAGNGWSRASQSDIRTILAYTAQLEAALGWYADPIMHTPTQIKHPQTAAAGDGGHRARAALGGERT